jgi:hypothetical protein
MSLDLAREHFPAMRMRSTRGLTARFTCAAKRMLIWKRLCNRTC